MILSMTGYGRASGPTRFGEMQVELRAVNGKHLDLKVRSPRFLFPLEPLLQKELRGRVSRGRVECGLRLGTAGSEAGQLKVDEDLAGAYLEVSQRLKAKFDLQGSPTVDLLLQLPGVLALEEPEVAPEALWEEVRPILAAAWEEFNGMRGREGAQLEQEFRGRLATLRKLLDGVDEHRQEAGRQFQARLAERLKDLCQNLAMDEARLAQEVALLAERTDITEEVVRLRSHLDQFETGLKGDKPVGRQLDFLLQEMFREANTIGSKTELLPVTRLVLEMKTEIDRLREQVQNVE